LGKIKLKSKNLINNSKDLLFHVKVYGKNHPKWLLNISLNLLTKTLFQKATIMALKKE
jgi:hypothetical protein